MGVPAASATFLLPARTRFGGQALPPVFAKALLHSLDFRDSGPVWSLQELHKELEA